MTIELVAVAAQIAPYLSAAAASMGTAVLVSAQNQIADDAVQRGRTLLDRLLRRDSGGEQVAEPEPGAGEVERLIGLLSAPDRVALAAAVGAWQLGGDVSEAALIACIRRAAGDQGDSSNYHTWATGPGSMAFGRVEGDVHGGYRPGPESTG